jgi:hypothetical protein
VRRNALPCCDTMLTMWLIDRSSGAFIALANLVVYGVIGVEIWMWTAASVLAVAFTLVLIAAVAGVICRATLHLMDDAAPGPVPGSVPVRVAAPAALAVTPAPAAPAPAPAPAPAAVDPEIAAAALSAPAGPRTRTAVAAG